MRINKLVLPIFSIVLLFATACSDDEPIVMENIVGTWSEQYPSGLQTEGFVTWDFSNLGALTIRVYDAFAGDNSNTYDYILSEEQKSITIAGDIKNSNGIMVHDTFAVYDVVKLTKQELRIKQSWVNTSYDELAPDEKNSFLLGGWKDVSFKR